MKETRPRERRWGGYPPHQFTIRRSRITSLRGIATALNDRGIRTARGGRWQVFNVRNVLARCEVDGSEVGI